MIANWIDGKACESDSGETFETIDPWAQVAHDTVALSGRTDVERAVDAARRAFDDGPRPRMGFAERGAILHRLADLIEANADELAAADSHDMGKPISAMLTKDVPRAAQNFRFFADHARMAASEV